MRGFFPVLRKEALQMLRDRGTLRFALFIPAFQLLLFGLIDMNVRHVPTVVFDQSRTAESRALLNDFVNTSYFDIVAYAPSRAARLVGSKHSRGRQASTWSARGDGGESRSRAAS